MRALTQGPVRGSVQDLGDQQASSLEATPGAAPDI